MVLGRICAVIAVFVCVLMALFTLSKYSTQVTTASQLKQEPLETRRIQMAPLREFRWHPANMAVASAAEKSIVTQLMAFKKDDYDKAALYESHMLKRNTIFFREMMRSQYPEFADYRHVIFGPIGASKDAQMAQVDVQVTGVDGITVCALYTMVKEDSIYRVADVQGGRRQS
jgi:hypothetical protein